MASHFPGIPEPGEYNPASHNYIQLAAHIEGMKKELAGIKTRRAGVDEKKDPSAAAKLDARIKHIQAEIASSSKRLPREQSVVDEDTEQATA